jgi:5'-nucleotidase / UDP-sugar diphosphatase
MKEAPMNKAKLFVLTLVMSAALSSSTRAQVDTITILHFNDSHANLAPIGPRDAALKGTLGGIARAATVIGMTRMQDPNTLVLHAGDAFIGDVFFNKYYGIAELQLFAALGFDAMAVGNHEFDLTPAVLQMALDTAFQAGGFPLLSANIDLQNEGVSGLKKFIQPYFVKQAGNVKVGIFGLTTPSANLTSQPSPAVISEDIVSIAAALVDTLHAKGCNVVILLSHLGADLDGIIAQMVPGINVIVGGHDHYRFDTPRTVVNPQGEPTYLVQANAFYLNAGKLQLSVSSDTIRMLGYEMIELKEPIPEEPTVAATVNSLIADIENTYGPLFTQRIGYAASDFEEEAKSPMQEGSKDTPVGNLVTDAFRAATGTDIAIEVCGSTAQKLFKGPIVADDIFRMIGYGFNTDNGLGFRIATFKITGEALHDALDTCVAMCDLNDEFLPQVSGMQYGYDIKQPANHRVVRFRTTIGTRKLDPAAVYTVTANEFAALFLPLLGIPISDVRIFTDTTEMHLVVAYIQAQDTIRPASDDRIIVYPGAVERSGAAPVRYDLLQNYPNPFNPTTTIVFVLPKTSLVSLKVFNLLGQEVAVLAEGRVGAGEHSFRFDGKGLASGIYLYRLHAGDFLQTKKMILMK